jgi:integrase
MHELLKLMGLPFTVHGFRSSFRDWAAECTGYKAAVCEAALGHAIPGAVERAYRRGDLFDRRRRLMADWAAFCGATAADGNVVAIRGGGHG